MKRAFPLVAISLLMMLSRVMADSSETGSGEIWKIDSAKNAITVGIECSCGSGKIVPRTFILKAETKIRLDGKVAKLADLTKGDMVQVEYEAEDNVISVIASRDN